MKLIWLVVLLGLCGYCQIGARGQMQTYQGIREQVQHEVPLKENAVTSNRLQSKTPPSSRVRRSLVGSLLSPIHMATNLAKLPFKAIGTMVDIPMHIVSAPFKSNDRSEVEKSEHAKQVMRTNYFNELTEYPTDLLGLSKKTYEMLQFANGLLTEDPQNECPSETLIDLPPRAELFRNPFAYMTSAICYVANKVDARMRLILSNLINQLTEYALKVVLPWIMTSLEEVAKSDRLPTAIVTPIRGLTSMYKLARLFGYL